MESKRCWSWGDLMKSLVKSGVQWTYLLLVGMEGGTGWTGCICVVSKPHFTCQQRKEHQIGWLEMGVVCADWVLGWTLAAAATYRVTQKQWGPNLSTIKRKYNIYMHRHRQWTGLDSWIAIWDVYIAGHPDSYVNHKRQSNKCSRN